MYMYIFHPSLIFLYWNFCGLILRAKSQNSDWDAQRKVTITGYRWTPYPKNIAKHIRFHQNVKSIKPLKLTTAI